MRRNFALFADFHQFVLRDAEADWGDLADRWTPDAVKEMFVQGDGYLAVGTARDTVVPVTVRIQQSEPADRPKGADQIVSARLPLPSGELVVGGVTDNEASGGRIAVEARDVSGSRDL
jgi:hypothetical protein